MVNFWPILANFQLILVIKIDVIVKVKVAQSCDSLRPHGLYSPWNSLGQNTGVGSCSFLQGILPTHWIKPKSPTLQGDSLPAEPPGKLKNTGMGSLILLQGNFPTQESNWGSCIAGRLFTTRATREDVIEVGRNSSSMRVQSCLTFCDPIDCILPGSSVYGFFFFFFFGKNTEAGCHCILQGISQPRDGKCVSCVSSIGRRVIYQLSQLLN